VICDAADIGRRGCVCVENLAEIREQYRALREEMDNYLNDLSNM